MTPLEAQSKVSAYRFSPQSFSLEEAQEIRDVATLYDIPLQNTGLPEPTPESNIFSQFGSGFVEGVLGPLSLGGWAEEPTNEAQSIAHSIGHLFGFALPMAGSVVSFGGTGLLRAGLAVGSKTGVGSRLVSAGDKIVKGGDFLKKSKSIPLAVGERSVKYTREALARAVYDAGKYLTKGGAIGLKAKAIDMGFQAQNLAVASTVSGLFNGYDDEMDNLIFGAVAGGFFGGLGNFVNTGKLIQNANPNVSKIGRSALRKHSETFAQKIYENRRAIYAGMAGSAFQGGMATLQGAPTATQIYEYALGGFFGATTHGVARQKANEYFTKWGKKNEDGESYSHAERRNMLNHESFKELPKDSQRMVKDIYMNHYGEMWNRFMKAGENFEKGEMLKFKSDAFATPSVVMGNAMRNSYERALKKKATTLEKKVNELNPLEQMEVKAELVEVVPSQYLIKNYVPEMTESMMRNIREETPLTGRPKEILDTLTSEQIKEIKSGVTDPLEKAITEYFEKLPTDRYLLQ